jgi:hypothetical protein
VAPGGVRIDFEVRRLQIEADGARSDFDSWRALIEAERLQIEARRTSEAISFFCSCFGFDFFFFCS